MECRLVVVFGSFVVGCLLNSGAGSVTMLTIEGEDMTSSRNVINSRDAASNGKVIHLEKYDSVYRDICITAPNATVHIENVVYSNDGGSDLVQVAFDRDVVAEFDTKIMSNGGRAWNIFHSVETYSVRFVEKGIHRLSLKVLKADTYGVDIDVIRLGIAGTQSKDSLMCHLFCFDDITYADDMPFKTTTALQGSAVQKSTQTQCAEEDNINIPVYHDNATKFVVSASLPKYKSFSNNREADWKNCQMMSYYWTFTNVTLNKNMTDVTKTAQLSVHMNVNNDSIGNIGMILVDFELEGPATGSMDSEIGTRVFLNGIHVPGNTSLIYQYRGRANVWSDPYTINVNGDTNNTEFKSPDFVFKEGKGNSIRIIIFENDISVGNISFDHLFMIQRVIKNDTSQSIYNDGLSILEIVDMDVWWRINETMTLTLSSDGVTHGNVDYFRIYQKVPWSDLDYGQVFVVYQDGNIRLLPITPHGLDWIPFGSSFILGQSNASSQRPSAPIEHLDVDPVNLKITINYLNGGFVKFQIKSSFSETQLIVSDSTYTRDLALFPFFTFRSMWIKDGNSDVDHITVDGKDTRGILRDWKSLHGKSFAFYRKCISKHNTLSPDIRLKIIA